MGRKLSLLLLVPAFVLGAGAAYAGGGHSDRAVMQQSPRQIGGRSGRALQPRPGDRRGPAAQRRHRPAPRYTHGRPYYWHGRPSYWRGHVYWNLSIHDFPRYGYPAWRSGHWHQGWYGGRWGWWWVVGGIWYYYAAPIYPYPNPYIPGTVVVVQEPSPPAPPAQAPAQYWYHCSAPEGYYPYVPECPGGWTKVTATPPSSGGQPQ